MKASYRVLCRVAMEHAYFADKQLRGLAARPTAATAERLRRTGLLLRPLPTGFEVVYAAADGGLPPAGLRAAFPLVFTLLPPTPAFAIYTDLPAAASPLKPGEWGVRYLAPLPANTPRLHQGPVMSEADQLPLRPLSFRAEWPAGASTAALWHYPDGPAVWKLPRRDSATGPLLIDLRAEGPGAYALRLGDAAPEVFVAADFAPATRPWALLELGPGVLDAPGLTYTLSLAARQTYWQYQIVSSSSHDLPAGLAIEPGKAGRADIKFVKVPALPGAAASFRADTAQPLAERYPDAAYQLVLPEANRAPQVLYTALPHASPAALRIENNPLNSLLVTDIFVHL